MRATFFLVGQWVDRYPESVQALAAAGHSVQNHSDTHPHLTELSRDGIAGEVNACNDKIEALTGQRPTLLRPPYGDYNDTVVTTIRSLGMEPIQWDVEATQSTGRSPAPCPRIVWQGGIVMERYEGETRQSGPYVVGLYTPVLEGHERTLRRSAVEQGLYELLHREED